MITKSSNWGREKKAQTASNSFAGLLTMIIRFRQAVVANLEKSVKRIKTNYTKLCELTNLQMFDP